MAFAERRKYPRISKSIPCQIGIKPSVYSCNTKNLSCGGALCQFPKPIPPMTKVDIFLEIPFEGAHSKLIHCTGVVVRQEAQGAGGRASSYLTAVYFSDIKAEDRRRIAEFILQSMLSYDRRRS